MRRELRGEGIGLAPRKPKTIAPKGRLLIETRDASQDQPDNSSLQESQTNFWAAA